MRLEAELFYWVLVAIFFAFWIPMHSIIPLYMQVLHTYELPTNNCTNELTSHRGTWPALREGLFAFYLIAPISGLFMIWTKNRAGKNAHLIALVALFLWGVTMAGFDINDMTTANLPPDNPRWYPDNLARDTRYCLAYAGAAELRLVCFISDICPFGSAVDPTQLRVDGVFAYRVGLNLILLAFCFCDFIFSLYTWGAVLQNKVK